MTKPLENTTENLLEQMSPKVSKYVKDGMTPKQRKLARGVVKGKSKAQAYRDAGYSSRFPSQDATKVLQKPEVQKFMVKEEQRLERAMQAGGITNERIIGKYDELIDAEKDGQPDNQSQLKALDQVHKIRGDYAPEKKEIKQLTLIHQLAEEIEE